MKSLRMLIFLVVALAQVAVPGSVVWRRAQTLQAGRVWKFRTAPVDPEDAFRGRYVLLGFAAEAIPQDQPMSGEKAYAVFKENAEGFAEVERLSPTPVSGDNVFKVDLRGWYGKVQHVHFPFDKYWVNEKLAPQAEAAYRANSTRKAMNAYVTVRVRAGDAAIEELYLDNKPLKEYLRGEEK